MAVAFASGRRHEDRAEQLKQLRRQMAVLSGKLSGEPSGEPSGAVGAGRRGHAHSDGLLPASETSLPVPESLAETLPDALPRGTVAVLSGARSLTLNLVASVTAAGGNAAIVGQPDIGLLAAVEMGADLSRIAVIPDPGADPVEIAAVLLDGMDLVVLGLAGRVVPLTRARAVVARARHSGCTLLVTDGDWQGASMRLAARVCGYETTCGTAVPGFGRISGVRIDVCARGRAIRAPTG